MNAIARNHYRIQFPVQERPILHMGATSASVLNLSEGGLMMSVPSSFVVGFGDRLEGRIAMPTGHDLKIAGRVKRQGDHHVALQFDELIPLGVIMELQRYLLTHYQDLEPAPSPKT